MARPEDPDVRLLRALRAGAAQATEWAEERLAGLRAAGYGIERGGNGAWRLASEPEALIADDILATLPLAPERVIGREIVVFQETGSTNDLVARAGGDGAREGLVLFAEKQRAGRGRLGRAWESPPRQGLWFSVLLRPVGVPVERWPELTFCAALAVAETAEEETGRPARIKWPNDVLINDRKIAGILLECHHREQPGFVVLGIGLNVRQREEDFDPGLRQRAGSLGMMTSGAGAKVPARREVAALLLGRLEEHYRQWPAAFAAIMRACEERGCARMEE